MIRYALQCDACGHEFEAWFASSDSFDDQSADGHVSCPACASAEVRKQIMAPAVARSEPVSPAAALAKAAAAVRAHIKETHTHVGDQFADEARAMHAGEKEARPIYGAAAPEEAQALKDEGVPVAPLPDICVPDDDKKLN